MSSPYFAPLELMGTRPVVKEPFIVKNVLEPALWNKTVNEVNSLTVDQMHYDRAFGRYSKKEGGGFPDELLHACLPLAREQFNSPTLLPTYAFYTRYKGMRANLHRHKDSNACTYTIDLCLTSKIDWPIVVEDKEYLLQPNEALLFYGEDQLHWRDSFPEKESNILDMVFLHYCEPDHWWFTQGPEYSKVTGSYIGDQKERM